MSIGDISRSSARDWLNDFRAEPTAASLKDLLTDRVYLGSLDAVDPDDLLLRWTNDPREDLGYTVDSALSDLVRHEWEVDDRDEDLVDLAWHRMMRVAASLEQAPDTNEFLWEMRGFAEERLGAFVKNSARDALGWFWGAVSRVQYDTSLMRKWQELCRLEDRTPVFHGHWGLLGLRRAPLDDLAQQEAVAYGLRDYAFAVAALVEERQLDGTDADLVVTTEMNAVRRAYPSSNRLREFWSQSWPALGDLERQWVQTIFEVDG
jgi:hypothetical protein